MTEQQSDRELLELAAKAVGIEFVYDDPAHCGYYSQWRGLSQWNDWNPLTDDGDALRLAVKLNINVFIYNDETSTATKGVVARNCGSKEANTRRAIVITAAEIGKGFA